MGGDRSAWGTASQKGARPGRALAGGLLLFGLTLLLAACVPNAPQDALEPVGEAARKADDLFQPVFLIAVGVFVLVEGALVYAIVRFRQRSDQDAPVQVHGNTKIEVIWTLIPAAILAGIAIPTVKGIFEFARPPTGDAIQVKVSAQQWWWEYSYEGFNVVTANELHIPTGRPVLLTLTAPPNDVIHSYWVPKLSGKQDVIPGQESQITLKTDRPGTYLGQCAEYCGTSHVNMRLRVIAQDPADFDAWVKAQQAKPPEPSGGLAARGKELFEKGRSDGKFPGGQACSGCHVIDPTLGGNYGPNLAHFASRGTFAGSVYDNTEENLTRWLRDPQEAKAGARMPDLKLTNEEIRALVAYLMTLR